MKCTFVFHLNLQLIEALVPRCSIMRIPCHRVCTLIHADILHLMRFAGVCQTQ